MKTCTLQIHGAEQSRGSSLPGSSERTSAHLVLRHGAEQSSGSSLLGSSERTSAHRSGCLQVLCSSELAAPPMVVMVFWSLVLCVEKAQEGAHVSSTAYCAPPPRPRAAIAARHRPGHEVPGRVRAAAAAHHRRQRMLFSLAMEDGKRRKKNMTCRARTSVIEERGCNEVFIYACRWAQVIFIRIQWHSYGK